VKIEEGQQKNKNRPNQPTIKFMGGFLPINFLPLPCQVEEGQEKITQMREKFDWQEASLSLSNHRELD